MHRSITIKDIARAAQVAPSTVSRALHADPRISEETTARVLHLARKMGYTPSLAARNLVTRRTNTIGLVVSCMADHFVGELVVSIEQAARSLGYSVFLMSAYRDAGREEEAVQSLHERRTDGIIVTGSQIDEGYLVRRDRFTQPIVLINCPRYPHSISTDNLGGARRAVSHLVELGHRHIAYVSNPGSLHADLDRIAGYREVLAEHGLPPDLELTVQADGTLAGGREAGQRLFALSRPPSALFCFNDLIAIGALSAIGEAGLHVPADCSVIGFDDLELAAYCCPPLTTVRQHRDQLGRRAVHMLHELIRGQGDVPGEMLPAELVVRHTTGPAPLGTGSGKEVKGR